MASLAYLPEVEVLLKLLCKNLITAAIMSEVTI